MPAGQPHITVCTMGTNRSPSVPTARLPHTQLRQHMLGMTMGLHRFLVPARKDPSAPRFNLKLRPFSIPQP